MKKWLNQYALWLLERTGGALLIVENDEKRTLFHGFCPSQEKIKLTMDYYDRIWK